MRTHDPVRPGSGRRRRWVPSAVGLLVAALTVSACDAQEATDTGSAARLAAVTISGDVGSAPQVDWRSPMSASGIETDTLVQGDGPVVADSQSVLAQVWIGNGSSEDQSYSSYDEGTAQLLTADSDLIPALSAAISGASVGSRVAVTAAGDEAFGTETGNPQLGIGGQDGVLLILDLVSAVVAGPNGVQTPAEDWAPAVVEADGDPVSLDASAAPQPVGKFRKTVLYAGDGARVRRNMTVAVQYLGQSYTGPQPFDQNYTEVPTTFRTGAGQVIEGWDKMVLGAHVGSRILIEVPPKLGYGAAGSPDLGITGTDTLFYVLDVVAAG